MDKDYGKKMAELHLRFKNCEMPYLNDEEVISLKNWLKEMHEYNFAMGHGINAIYFAREYESFDKVCDARGLK